MIDRDAGRVDYHVLIKGGVGESRVDLKNVDAEPPPFDANRFREPGDGELAGRILGAARQSAAGIDRAHGDHHGVAAAGKEGQRFAADLGHGEDVDLEDAAEHRGIVRIELPGRAHAGIVDDQVERAKAFACQSEKPATILFDRQIGRNGDHPGRIGPFTLQATDNGRHAFCRSPGQQHGRPGADEARGQGLAKPRRCPGDQASRFTPGSSSHTDGASLGSYRRSLANCKARS